MTELPVGADAATTHPEPRALKVATTDAPLTTPDLDGHTIDELSEYLDRGRAPFDPSIELSPGCQVALASLERLRLLSRTVIDEDAAAGVASGDGLVEGTLANIDLDAYAGRDVPVRNPGPRSPKTLREGDVRGLVRSVGDTAGEFLIGRIVLDGDVATPDAPITVAIDVSVLHGIRIPDAVTRLRNAVFAELLARTLLAVVAIDITVSGVHLPSAPTLRPKPKPKRR